MSESKSQFSGATTESAMADQAPAHAQTDTQVTARESTAAQVAQHPAVPNDHENQTGRPDESIPVSQGNSHLLIGSPKPDNPDQPRAGQKTLAGPGTENPSGGVTRTVGMPESAAPQIEQVGGTVILEEDKGSELAPEFAPGKPPPRTDVDAEPSDPSEPGFQGLDRVNPLPVPQPLNTIEHRGGLNEPRVVGVQTAGGDGGEIKVVGSESDEAKAATGGDAQGGESSRPLTEQERSAAVEPAIDRRYPIDRRGSFPGGKLDRREDKTERRVAERRKSAS